MRRLLRSLHLPWPPIGWSVMNQVQQMIGHRFDAIASERSIAQVRCLVLLAHGRDDVTVPFDDARRLLAAGLQAVRQATLLQHEVVLLAFLAQAFGQSSAVSERSGQTSDSARIQRNDV
jgi:hypothetical protein